MVMVLNQKQYTRLKMQRKLQIDQPAPVEIEPAEVAPVEPLPVKPEPDEPTPILAEPYDDTQVRDELRVVRTALRRLLSERAPKRTYEFIFHRDHNDFLTSITCKEI